ncbi:hypothetical protein BH20CHL7_BH20CHL7_13290 [soil metagenome]
MFSPVRGRRVAFPGPGPPRGVARSVTGSHEVLTAARGWLSKPATLDVVGWQLDGTFAFS